MNKEQKIRTEIATMVGQLMMDLLVARVEVQQLTEQTTAQAQKIKDLTPAVPQPDADDAD